MEKDDRKNPVGESVEFELLSIKERLEAANYAIKVKGEDPDEDDVSDVIGEVYGG